MLLLFAWFSLDLLGESYDRVRIVILVHWKAAELIECTMVHFFEMCSPFINEIKGFNRLYIQFLTGLKYIIDHDCFLSLEILKIAACCDDFFERKNWHSVLRLISSQIVLKFQVNESLLLKSVDVERPLSARTNTELNINSLDHFICSLVERSRLRFASFAHFLFVFIDHTGCFHHH